VTVSSANYPHKSVNVYNLIGLAKTFDNVEKT